MISVLIFYYIITIIIAFGHWLAIVDVIYDKETLILSIISCILYGIMITILSPILMPLYIGYKFTKLDI